MNKINSKICISHNKENAKGAKILKERFKAIDNLGYIDKIEFKSFQKAV